MDLAQGGPNGVEKPSTMRTDPSAARSVVQGAVAAVSRSRGPGPGRALVTFVAVTAAVAACGVDRDRPTGLATTVPETLVRIAAPERDQLVPADSITTVVVEARGLLQAVEIQMRTPHDLLHMERKDLEQPEEVVAMEFEVRIPDFATGSHLEFRGVAENIIGERRESDAVGVIIVDCEVFQIACGGG